MRITRGVAVALLATFFSLPSMAQLTSLSAMPEGPEVRVIVELREAPLLGRREGEVRAAAASLDTLLARLEADLGAIEARERRAPRAASAGERLIRFRYKLTFAGASARVSREALPALRALPYVKAVHPDRLMGTHLEHSVPRIGAPYVWDTYGLRGKGVVVAIVDTGVDYNHKALGRGFGPGFRVIGGYDFINDDPDPMDDHAHGTHVAGIVAANSTTLLGVAPDATLLAYKVLDKDGQGTTSTVIAGLERAVDPDGNGDPSDHADVINMSLGGPRSFEDPLVDAVERAVAAGAVVVLSAGNSRANGSVGSPAVAPSAIAVAATDDQDMRAPFSSRGPVGGSWALKPEIGAPGTYIVSAKKGGGTLSASGTSMAAPHVAGVAALILQKHPDWTPAQVKAAIVSTGKPAYFAGDPTIESVLAAGGGRLDARAAVEATILPSPATVSFGLLRRGTPFSGTQTVRLTNKGAADETLTFTAPELPKGATLTITPASLTVPKGGSAEVTFKLAVEAAHPWPNEDSVALAGLVQATGRQTSLRLPWIAVNGGVITVTFAGTDDTWALLSGRDFNAVTWPEGPRTLGGFTQDAATMEIVGYFRAPNDGPRRLVVRENVPVGGYVPITISPDEAKYKVEFAARDEQGEPFAALVARGEAESTLSQDILLRNWSLVSFPDLVGNPDANGDRILWMSGLTETQFRTVEVVKRGNALYATMYPLLRGLTEDRKLETQAGDWAMQTIAPTCRTKNCKAWWIPGAGGFPLFRWHELTNGPAVWKLFMTQRIAPEYDFRAHVAIQEEGFAPQQGANPWSYLSPAFRNVGGRITLAPFSRSYASADYSAGDPNKPLVLGDGPVVLRTTMGTTKIEALAFGGALGEYLGSDAAATTFALFDSSGKELSLLPSVNQSVRYIRKDEPKGAFRLELSLPYRIEGQAGRVSQRTLFDTRLGFGSPTVTMLRVEDGSGNLSNTVRAHGRGRLVFAGRDSQFHEQGVVYHQFIETSATRAWWRPTGTNEWRPLAVTQIGSDYDFRGQMPGPPGDIFAAELAPALAETGPVDIRIDLMNGWDATSEVVFSPAFIVTQPDGRRRAVR